METEINPFGKSIGIIVDSSQVEAQNLFRGPKGSLIEQLAFHMADTGMTGGMHFFGVNDQIKESRRRFESIIFLGEGNPPTDIIDRIMYKDGKPTGFEFFGPERTPILQINFSGKRDIIDPKKFIRVSFGNEQNQPWDIARMDLVDSGIETEGLAEKVFAIRNISRFPANQLLSQKMALKIAEIMNIPSKNIEEDWSDIIKDNPKKSSGGYERTHSY